MNKIFLGKADIIDCEIEDIQIEISEKIPTCTNSELTLQNYYNKQAEMLYIKLKTTLPQATLDRLTLKLLEQEVSLLRIAIKEAKNGEQGY